MDYMDYMDYIEIDGNTRRIKITQEQRLFGVVQDVNAERKYFKMPKIVGNDIDITKCIIYIIYQKSDEYGNVYYGESNKYICDDVLLDETQQNVTFSWELTKDIFDISGYLGFKILVEYTDNDGNIKNVWNTIPEFGIVYKSMFGDEVHVQEQKKDIVNKILQDLKQIGNEMKTKITQPDVAKEGQTFRIKQINDDGTLTLEAVDMPSGGSGGAVDDVRINGTSIVGENGVAEIPNARRHSLGVVSVSNGVSITAGGALTLDWAYEGNVESRAGTKVLRAQNIDYAVKCAMCDGKGAEWTAEEQVAARERMGIGNWELITEVDLDTETARYILCSCDEYDKINIFLKRDANNTSLTGSIQVIIIDKSDNIVCELFSKPNTGYRNTLFELNCINGYAFGTYMTSNNLCSSPAHISPAFYVGSGNRYCVNIPSPSTACDGLSKMIVIGRRK